MARSGFGVAAALAAVAAVSLVIGGAASAQSPAAVVSAAVAREFPGTALSPASVTAGTGTGPVSAAVGAKYRTVRGAIYGVEYRNGYVPTVAEERAGMARLCTTTPVWDPGVGVVCWRETHVTASPTATLRLLRASSDWPLAPSVEYTLTWVSVRPAPTMPRISPEGDFVDWTDAGSLYVAPWAGGGVGFRPVAMAFGAAGEAVTPTWRLATIRLADGRVVTTQEACAYTRITPADTPSGYAPGGLHCINPVTGMGIGF